MFEINDLLVEVLEREASDLHITAGVPPTIRVNGNLQHLEYPKLMPKDTQDIIYSILTQEQREQVERNNEFDLSYSVPGRSLSLTRARSSMRGEKSTRVRRDSG